MKELKIPTTIWLQWYGDGDPKDGGPSEINDGVTWNLEKVFDHDVCYVRAAKTFKALRKELDESDSYIQSLEQANEKQAIQIEQLTCCIKRFQNGFDEMYPSGTLGEDGEDVFRSVLNQALALTFTAPPEFGEVA